MESNACDESSRKRIQVMSQKSWDDWGDMLLAEDCKNQSSKYQEYE